MEILNDFPSPSSRAVVVVSSLYILSDRDLELPNIVWVTHWQLTLAMRGEFALADLFDSYQSIVLCSLVMSQAKRAETLRFLKSIGVNRVSLVPEGDTRLKKWLYSEPERKAKVGLIPPLKTRPSTLVVGFEPDDFSEELQRLCQVGFFPKSRVYSFDGQVKTAQKAFINGQLDSVARHLIRKQLVQAGVPELGISVERDLGALKAHLAVQFQRFLASKPTAYPPPKREAVLVVGFEQIGAQPSVIWWPDPDTMNDWSAIPQNVGRIISSRRLSKWDRLELESVAMRRGISLTFCDIEQKLEELLESVVPSPSVPTTEKKQPTGEKEMAKSRIDGVPSKTEIIRQNGERLEWNIDKLLELVMVHYPDYSRSSLAALVYATKSNMASRISAAKSSGVQRPESLPSSASRRPKLIDIACEFGPGYNWDVNTLLEKIREFNPDYSRQRIHPLVHAAKKKLASHGNLPKTRQTTPAAALSASADTPSPDVVLVINQAVIALQAVGAVVKEMHEKNRQMEKRLKRLAPFEKALEEMGVQHAGAK